MDVVFKYRIPLLLAILKFLLPFFLQHNAYELQRDEYLYLQQGHHLAWGYMEVPPLLSVFAWISQLFGQNFFMVKLWPSLFGACTLFVACLMTMEMGGKQFAQFITGLSMIAGAYLRVNFLFQANFLEIFFWTFSAYSLLLFIKTHAPHYLYWIAVSLALGFMSKHSAVFFMLGIFVAMLATPYRKLLLFRQFYVAAGIALLLVLPNLLWQYFHSFPVVHHMKELRETQLVHIGSATFLVNQLLMNLPAAFVWIGGLIWLLFFKQAKRYRMIALIYLSVILLLMICSGKDYYALGTYPMLFAAGGVWLEQVAKKRWYWTRYAAVAVILLLFTVSIPVLLPVWTPNQLAAYYHKYGMDKSGLLKWEDQQQHPLPQDFADMLGWREMATKVSTVYHQLPDSTQAATLIYCRNYGQAGAVNYYGQQLPFVHSDNGSFLLWMPDTFRIKNLLFVGETQPEKGDEVFDQFEHVKVMDSITNPLAREFGTKIILYENGNNKVNGMIEKGIKEMKAPFNR